MSFILITLVSVTSVIAKDTFNTRFLIHATKPIVVDSNWRVTWWSILPNFTAEPSTILHIGGLGYRDNDKNKDRWSIEVMGGLLTVEQKSKWVIDIRISYNASDPFYFRGKVGYFPRSREWYSYTGLEIDYRLPIIGLVGIESENKYFYNKIDDLSCGFHLALPFGNCFRVVNVYQWHNNGDKQIWVRVFFNFQL